MSALIKLVILFSLSSVKLLGQELGQRVIVLAQSDSYPELLQVAEESARELEMPLNLRNLDLYQGKYLSFSQKTCELSGKVFPCYKAREIDGSVAYLSIESTSEYANLPEKRFSLIVAIHRDEDAVNEIILKQVRKHYSKAMFLMTKADADWKLNF